MGIIQLRLGTWLHAVVTAIVGFLNGIKDDVHQYSDVAEAIVQRLMTLQDSPVVQFLENDLIKLLPAPVQYLVNGLKLELPVIFKELGWVKDESGKTDEQILSDGLSFLQSKQGTDFYNTHVTSLRTHLIKFLNDNQGTGLTSGQASVLSAAKNAPEITQ